MKGGLWRRIKAVALTDVGMLLRGGGRELLEGFERVLLEADFGPAAFPLLEALEDAVRRGTLRTEQGVREWLAQRIASAVRDSSVPGQLALDSEPGPSVLLFVGVNGVGKTTQVAKIAHRLSREGRSVMLAAADTYRAGASEQLEAWASRLGVPCVTGAPRTDPAAVAFDAIESATSRGVDVVLVDTAGRLHTQQDLMGELRKIHRVIARKRAGAPHEVFLVLDATTGQNMLQQGRTFAAALPLTGLILTKLDGTAKGGGIVALRTELPIPIRFVGVGEGLDDLEPFDADRFTERLLAD
ncbi:MAG TPA: signal recognition particle-docking protein FtsY [Gemmatimonadales bacterium]|nr:signal recognition particle-docking protein FtsY [Gemmatimonadales bacterium]